MKTIKEAAALSGRTERQIRAHIELGWIATGMIAGITVLTDDTVVALATERYVPSGLAVVVVKIVAAMRVDPSEDLLGRSWLGLDPTIRPVDPEWPEQQLAIWGVWPLKAGRDDEIVGHILLPVVMGKVAPWLAGPITGIAREVRDAAGLRRVLFEVEVPPVDKWGGAWV